MANGFFSTPKATCEKVMSYAPGSPERNEAKNEYQKMISKLLTRDYKRKKLKQNQLKIYTLHMTTNVC